MKYWKKGFYDTLQKGAVEISDEYYMELLNGQSSGKEIYDDSGFPFLKEHQYSIDELKEMKVVEIESYDKSEAVNSFMFNNISMWFDKATRVGLMNSINIEKQAGKLETSLWFKGQVFNMSLEQATNILREVELYSLACYNVTQRHIANVNQLTTKGTIDTYDFKVGYPEKLVFG